LGLYEQSQEEAAKGTQLRWLRICYRSIERRLNVHGPIEEYQKLRAAHPGVESLALDMARTGRSLRARMMEGILNGNR
jgi:hypothetical protein